MRTLIIAHSRLLVVAGFVHVTACFVGCALSGSGALPEQRGSAPSACQCACKSSAGFLDDCHWSEGGLLLKGSEACPIRFLANASQCNALHSTGCYVYASGRPFAGKLSCVPSAPMTDTKLARTPVIHPERSAFRSLCPFGALLLHPGAGGSPLTVRPCPREPSRDSEWFGLSGPVKEVSDGGDVLRFDSSGSLQSAQRYEGVLHFQRTKAGISYNARHYAYHLALDEKRRPAIWTKRCASDCRVGLARPEAGTKESEYHYPVGTLTQRTTYQYPSETQLVVIREEFDSRNGSAQRPGTRFRVTKETYSVNHERRILSLSTVDNIGGTDFRHSSEWSISADFHIQTIHAGKAFGAGYDTYQAPLTLDQHGNWIQWGPIPGALDPYALRQITYHSH